ncbi:MAG: carboxypeptidase regulatory-like domain-containing protein, partial [Planctomycetota bacterium]|nr:carboxypeptidase regulatory-like domain-containing protein [Planctomycetota bacterium]
MRSRPSKSRPRIHGPRAFFVLGLVVACAAASAPAAELIPRHVPEKPTHTKLWPGLRDDLIIVKFVEGTRVRLREGRLVSRAGADTADANRILTEREGLVTTRLFSRDEADLERDRVAAQAASGREMADLNNYYTVKLEEPSVAAAEQLIDELNALPEVEIAYAEPVPELAVLDRDDPALRRRQSRRFGPSGAGSPGAPLNPATPDFESLQGYLGPAPDGVDAYAAWTYEGGRGETVKIIDIELGWNWTHEDHKPPFFQGGEQQYSDHGVAVVGEIMGQDNGYGVTGISNEVEIGCYAVWNIPTADAFDLAAAQLDPGDIYIIELHCPGPGGNYIALEWWQANFDAIAMATARGVICLEAAGNGSADFDHARYEGRFDRTIRDSGAIIIGATDGSSLDPAYFTNHGSRVDLAGWGFDVVTTGYGDLQGGPQNEWYTAGFSGTSSATPIVTGTVACMQGIYKAQSGGEPLDGQTIAQLLKETGTPTNGPEQIGPRPNLALAVPAMLGELTAIEGTVTDADGGAPLEDVEMRIVEVGTRTVTAEDGTYALPVTPGTWTVRATKFGYDTDETVVGAASPGQVTYDVALDPTPTVELAGVVWNENGQGIENAEVSIPDTPLPPVMSGPVGEYAIADVPETLEGLVVVTKTGMTPDVRLLDASGNPNVDLRLAVPEDFEADEGGFVADGYYNDWEWGTPDFEQGPDAHSGQHCWGTNLTGMYGLSDDHELVSPEFDLTDMVDPRLTLWHWYSIWGPYDGINVEITDDGSNWDVLHPVGGYSDSCIDGLPGYGCEPGWAGSTNAWVPLAFDLSDYAGETVSFRFTVGTWQYTASPGWYIDDVQVHGAGESCPADFDGDGDVDTADLLFLLSAWGTPDGDVDGDGDT